MKKSKTPKSNLLASHRRFEPMDLNKSSSSLNMSTSSLRSTGEEIRKDGGAGAQASRRATTVRFAPPPSSSSSSSAAAAAASTKAISRPVSRQGMVRPSTASGARPGSSSGPRARSSAGRNAGELPGPKVMRRSWGWTGGVEAKELRNGDPMAVKIVAQAPVRSSSAPRRYPSEEKPLQKIRGSKIKTTSRMKADTPPKPETEGSKSPPTIATKTGDPKPPNSVSMNNIVKVSPTRRTSVTTIGASWESLPSDIQSLGQEVMRYRDDAEVAAVEALQQASSAEILLRCLSAFADLTYAAAEQSPQQTVDEFLVVHAALAASSAAVSGDGKRDHHHAGDWLRAAISTDLAPVSLYSASSSSPQLTERPAAVDGDAGDAEQETWLEAARRALGEDMRAWFLGHVERLLDGDVAGTLGQLKRVSDWLDGVGGASESEAVERVRKKIYGYLLDHVESAVVALNGGVGPCRRK